LEGGSSAKNEIYLKYLPKNLSSLYLEKREIW